MPIRLSLRATVVAAITAAATFAIAPASGLVAEASAQEASAGKPISLKTFTKPKIRNASAAKSRKSRTAKASSTTSSKASRHKREASRNKPAAAETAQARAGSAKLSPKVSDAFAQAEQPKDAAPTDANLTQSAAPEQTPPEQQTANADPAIPPAAEPTDAAAATPLVTSETTPNVPVDVAAWAPKDEPKLTAAAMESRAEMREEPSPWQNTSTIGKVFVALGALLTIGSAVRMCIA